MKQTMRIMSMATLFVLGTMAMSCESLMDDHQPAFNGTVILTASVNIESSSTKALDASGNKTFAVNEEIAVVYPKEGGTKGVAVKKLTTNDIKRSGKAAYITVTLTDNPVSGDIRFVYPAAMVDEEGNEVSIATQDGTLETLASKLDYAAADGTLTIDGSTATITSGVTLANQFAIGKFTVEYPNNADITGDVTVFTVNDGTYCYTINRIAAAGPIYVAMRPVSDDKTITVCAKAGTTKYSKKVTGKALTKDFIYNITLKDMIQGAVPGLFTINSSNDKVFFSQGNLQYQASSTTWRFAESQQGYIGNTTSNLTPTEDQTEWMDLFGWGTKNNPTKTDGGGADYTWNEWGDNAISNGGNTVESGWKTLTQEELSYVLKSRVSGITVNNTNNARYTMATVNGVKGLIIFPDNYCGPDANLAEDIKWSTINGKTDYSTRCNANGWCILEASGCVFLPAGGERNWINKNVANVQVYGQYWTKTSYSTNMACDLKFGTAWDYGMQIGSNNFYNRRMGESVRLVKSAN